jgi:hypothetical protein
MKSKALTSKFRDQAVFCLGCRNRCFNRAALSLCNEARRNGLPWTTRPAAYPSAMVGAPDANARCRWARLAREARRLGVWPQLQPNQRAGCLVGRYVVWLTRLTSLSLGTCIALPRDAFALWVRSSVLAKCKLRPCCAGLFGPLVLPRYRSGRVSP